MLAKSAVQQLQGHASRGRMGRDPKVHGFLSNDVQFYRIILTGVLGGYHGYMYRRVWSGLTSEECPESSVPFWTF